MTDFSEARAAMVESFIDTGLWLPIRVTSQDSPPVVTETSAGYRQPTDVVYEKVDSQDHRIEYVATTLPDLAEGDTVEFLDADGNVIADKRFTVRSAPTVQNDIAGHGDGYFKRALLTQL